MFVTLLLIIFILGGAFLSLVYLYTSLNKPTEVEVFEEIRDPHVLQVIVPRENDKTPLAAEQLFASIHGTLRGREKSLDLISFEIVSTFEGGIKFYVVLPGYLVKFVEGQIYAQYPTAEIHHVQDYTPSALKPQTLTDGTPYTAYITAGEIELAKDFIFPIRTFRDFEVDPLSAITGAMSELKDGEEVWLQLVVRPVDNTWQQISKDYISAVREGRDIQRLSLTQKFLRGLGSFLSALITPSSPSDEREKDIVKLEPGQEEELRKIEEKMQKVGFEIAIRVITKAPEKFASEQLLRDLVASFKQYTTAHLNSFKSSEPNALPEEVFERYTKRFMPANATDLLNIEELASLFHLPNSSVQTPNIHWARSKKLEPPMNLPTMRDKDVTIFGKTNYRSHNTLFGLKVPDRRRHMYLLGKTGVGKSSTFKNMFISDVLRGSGACYIDPHGQDIEELLDYIPESRIDDVVYFDPADTDFPIGFNMLQLKDPTLRDLVADGVVSVFKKQFGDSWGPRLQYLLQNTVATALEAQGTTLLAVQRILTDKNYRKFILKQVKDPILLKFWHEEYAQMAQNSRLLSESLSPIQNKIGRFIANSTIRNIVGQVKSTIDLREIMDNKKILMVNLAQGRLGEESASLLGGMLISRLQSTAMERVDLPEDERTDFYLYVDEFQNFATESFAKILSEARKFRLNLTMTNQYIEQIPLVVRHAIFGNVGTMASFVVSQADAHILAEEFAPDVSPEDLVAQEAHAMYVKLSIDGMTSKPFSAKSLDYKKRLEKYGLGNKIRERSRERYTVPRSEIEAKINKWATQKYSDKGNRSTA